MYSQRGSGLCGSFVCEELGKKEKDCPNVFLLQSSQDPTTISRPNPSARGTSHGARAGIKGGDDTD